MATWTCSKCGCSFRDRENLNKHICEDSDVNHNIRRVDLI